jgi:hypothetical protein
MTPGKSAAETSASGARGSVPRPPSRTAATGCRQVRNHLVSKFEGDVSPGQPPLERPGQVGPVRLRPQEHDDALDGQVVAAVQQDIVPQQAAGEVAVVARLQLDVEQPGLGGPDAEDLVGLGGDRREVGVEHADGPLARPPEIAEPGVGVGLQQIARRGVERLGHVGVPPA